MQGCLAKFGIPLQRLVQGYLDRFGYPCNEDCRGICFVINPAGYVDSAGGDIPLSFVRRQQGTGASRHVLDDEVVGIAAETFTDMR